jgi:hypothetical protein
MKQDRLFRLAVEDGIVTMHHVPGSGWELVVKLRRGQETWSECDNVAFSRLTTVELLDTLAAHLDVAL